METYRLPLDFERAPKLRITSWAHTQLCSEVFNDSMGLDLHQRSVPAFGVLCAEIGAVESSPAQNPQACPHLEQLCAASLTENLNAAQPHPVFGLSSTVVGLLVPTDGAGSTHWAPRSGSAVGQSQQIVEVRV